MEQQRPLQLIPTQMRSVTATASPEPSRGILPTPPPPAHQFTCTLPVVPPHRVLTPPISTASISVRRLEPVNPDIMLPSPFRGERWRRCAQVHRTLTVCLKKNARAPEKHKDKKFIRCTYDREFDGDPKFVNALMPSTDVDGYARSDRTSGQTGATRTTKNNKKRKGKQQTR